MPAGENFHANLERFVENADQKEILDWLSIFGLVYFCIATNIAEGKNVYPEEFIKRYYTYFIQKYCASFDSQSPQITEADWPHLLQEVNRNIRGVYGENSVALSAAVADSFEQTSGRIARGLQIMAYCLEKGDIMRYSRIKGVTVGSLTKVANTAFSQADANRARSERKTTEQLQQERTNFIDRILYNPFIEFDDQERGQIKQNGVWCYEMEEKDSFVYPKYCLNWSNCCRELKLSDVPQPNFTHTITYEEGKKKYDVTINFPNDRMRSEFIAKMKQPSTFVANCAIAALAAGMFYALYNSFNRDGR